MHLHIHHHADQRVVDKLDILLAGQELLMDNVDRLIEDIQRRSTLEDGLMAYNNDLKHQVADALAGAKLAKEHEDKLAAIFPGFEARNDEIAAALATQSDGTTPVPPPVVTPDPAPTPDPVPTPVPTPEPTPPLDGLPPTDTSKPSA